jgi:photosystem II stability/assembly factor-like uncharacterized protein
LGALTLLATACSHAPTASRHEARLSSPGALTAVSCLDRVRCLAVGVTATGRTYEVRSTDGGRRWSVATAPPDIGTPISLSCSDARHCVVLGSRAARTDDGGRQWSPAPIPLDTTGVSCAHLGNCVAVGTYGRAPHVLAAAAVTTDGGRHFTRHDLIVLGLPGGTPTVVCPSRITCLAFTPAPEGKAATEVYASADGGSTWRRTAEIAGAAAVSCGAATCLAFDQTWHLAVSHDGGMTWMPAPLQLSPTFKTLASVGQVACVDAQRCVVTTHVNDVLTTGDGATMVATVPIRGVGTQAVTCDADARCLVAGFRSNVAGPSGALARSTDGGRHFARVWSAG